MGGLFVAFDAAVAFVTGYEFVRTYLHMLSSILPHITDIALFTTNRLLWTLMIFHLFSFHSKSATLAQHHELFASLLMLKQLFSL